MSANPRRVAVSLEMDWGFKRHLEVYAGCQRYADEAGWECEVNPAAHRYLDAGENAFDGVIARATESLASAAENSGVPVVNVWINSPTTLPSVFADSKSAGEMAAEHLLSRGFRQFGFLGEKRDLAARQALKGFSDKTAELNFSCSSYRYFLSAIEGNAPGWQGFISGLEAWIDSWKLPIGIFTTQDLVCRYLVNACKARGLHISQDVAIVGLGNEPILCESPSPTLSSIDLGYAQVGYRAAALLDSLMNGTPRPDSPELVPPTELVPRQSTDSFAADDPLVARALRHIAENSHHGPMKVTDVAMALATTRRTLERRFQQSVGRSIAGEITRLRVERAKRLLVETDLQLKQVAQECGFRTADHFYKVFVRSEKIPPTQYRNERQQVFVKDSFDPLN